MPISKDPRPDMPIERWTGRLDEPMPFWIRRLVGIAALVPGIAILWLSTAAFVRDLVLARPFPQRMVLPMLGVVLVGVLLVTVGVRLVRRRESAEGSILSRGAWILLGLVFVGVAVTGAVALPWNSDHAVALLASLFLATGCFGVAFRPYRPPAGGDASSGPG